MVKTDLTSLTIPVNQTLNLRIKEVANLREKSEQEIILEAIEKYLQDFPTQKSCYDLAQELGIISCIKAEKT